jgi:hypothetical protein
MFSRARVVALPGPGEAGEPLFEDHDDSDELWEVIASLLPDERTRRVAYLLFHCGLKPREIVHFCPEEFSDVQEIDRRRPLRRTKLGIKLPKRERKRKISSSEMLLLISP